MRVRHPTAIRYGTWVAAQTAALFLALAACPGRAQIIPQPDHVSARPGCFALDAATPIAVDATDKGAAFAASYLAARWRESNGLKLHTVHGLPSHAIRFAREPSLQAEGYRLTVTTDGIGVSATSEVGLLYGAVSLWQLLPAAQSQGCIPAQIIDDAPRYAWRGLMLDSARHFQSVQFVRRMLDWMAWHKLNVLQWHLTDDQGWRIEIKKYPRLTAIGAWRDGYGGFYRQEEIRELVAYGAARGVRIVPEIDLPGHVTALLAAYPEFGATGQPMQVSSSWGVHTHLISLAPASLRAVEDILREVLALFPSRDIHLGGDEVVKTEWLESPAMRALAERAHLPDAGSLQPLLTARMAAFLTAHGRRLVGWDEVLTPTLPKDAIVMSWRGVAGAQKAALQGNDTVLSPDPAFYLDHRQSALANEPPGRILPITSESIYRFDSDATLPPGQQAHLLGVQANIWTEHIRTEPRVEWMALPRAAALAELGWSRQRDWQSFVARLPGLFARYAAARLNYADSVFGIDQRIDRAGAEVRLTLKNTPELPASAGASIRYALDAQSLGPASPAYRETLLLEDGKSVNAATFVGDRQASRTIGLRVDAHSGVRRDSHDLALCSFGVPLLMEAKDAADDPHQPMAIDVLNPCWIDSGVDLARGATLVAAVAPLLFNFEIGKAVEQIRIGDAVGARGELEVHVDDCNASPLARLPLTPAAAAGVSVLPPARLAPLAGRHDLCFRFARPTLNPQWGLDWVEISE